MRKIIAFTFIIIHVFCLSIIISSNNKLKAAEEKVEVDGVQIRTEHNDHNVKDDYGIRFRFRTTNINIEEVDYFAVLVKRSSNPVSLTLANAANFSDHSIVKLEADSFFEDNIFVGSIVNIPDEDNHNGEGFNPVEDNLTAVGVVVLKEGDPIYSVEVTNNVVDVARKDFNRNDVHENDASYDLVQGASRNIKITKSDSSVVYHSITSFDGGSVLEAGDTVDFCKTLDSEKINTITIDKNNITLNGANKDNELDTEGNRNNDIFETIVDSQILIKNDSEPLANIIINGLSIESTGTSNPQPIYFDSDDISSVAIKYNRVIFRNQNGISSNVSNTTFTYNNINIEHNYLKGHRNTATAGDRVIYFNSPVDNIAITNNTITDSYNTDTALELKEANIGVRLTRIQDNGFILVKDNIFGLKHANYLILIGEQMDALSYIGNIVIENNALGFDSNHINSGNIFGIYGLNAGSTINIIHNYSTGKISPYYNTIGISTQTYGSSFKNDSNETLINVNIKFNIFIPESYKTWADNLGTRTAISSNNVRVGLNIGPDSTVVFDNNYYTGSLSLYAYKDNSSKTGGKSPYTVASIDDYKASSREMADDAYLAYLGL